MKIKLYYTPRTRATRVRWLLEELEQPYEIIDIDLFNGGGNTAEYKKIHPLGYVPAIDVNGDIMFESAAICEWLTDQFPEKKLAPHISSTERMKYIQWLYYISATMEPYAWNSILHSKLLPESERIKDIIPWCDNRFQQTLTIIDEELKNREFLLGERFTTADILLTSLLSWRPQQVKPYHHACNYLNRLMQRYKYQLVMQQP